MPIKEDDKSELHSGEVDPRAQGTEEASTIQLMDKNILFVWKKVYVDRDG